METLLRGRGVELQTFSTHGVRARPREAEAIVYAVWTAYLRPACTWTDDDDHRGDRE